MDIFNNEHEVLTIGNLIIENRLGHVIIHGDVQIKADEVGRSHAKALAEFAQNLLMATDEQDERDLSVKQMEVIDNPFG
ncbi:MULTISPECIES: hypothetical protein [unclassified Moraxella]|uniref:hypothetical protein n=1 Tax=unclassified Moraxella TaxID=2685852 RepID=UPI00359F09CC